MIKGFLTGLIIVLVLGGLYLTSTNSNSTNMEGGKVEAEGMMESDPSESTDKIEEVEEMGMMEGDESSMLVSDEEKYVDYSSEAYDMNADKKRVLFFHAKWCPTCKSANASFESNVSKIPDDVVVLITDYDSENELKKKYGITYQHTFVLVDENGEEINKWNGGELEELLDRV
jgi:thioredoxin 1